MDCQGASLKQERPPIFDFVLNAFVYYKNDGNNKIISKYDNDLQQYMMYFRPLLRADDISDGIKSTNQQSPCLTLLYRCPLTSERVG